MNFNYGLGASALGGLTRGIGQGLQLAEFFDQRRRRDQLTQIEQTQENRRQQAFEMEKKNNEMNRQMAQINLEMAQMNANDQKNLRGYWAALNGDTEAMKMDIPEGGSTEFIPNRPGSIYQQYPIQIIKDANGNVVKRRSPGYMVGLLSGTPSGKSQFGKISPEMEQIGLAKIGSLFTITDMAKKDEMLHALFSGDYGDISQPNSNPVQFFEDFQDVLSPRDERVRQALERSVRAKEFSKAAVQGYANAPAPGTAKSARMAQSEVTRTRDAALGMLPTNWPITGVAMTNDHGAAVPGLRFGRGAGPTGTVFQMQAPESFAPAGQGLRINPMMGQPAAPEMLSLYGFVSMFQQQYGRQPSTNEIAKANGRYWR